MKNSTKRSKNPHLGTALDSFLKEEGIYEEVKAATMKRVLAMQAEKESEKNKNLDVSNLVVEPVGHEWD